MEIIFGAERYHQYSWGKALEPITDHKPLLLLMGADNSIPIKHHFELITKRSAQHREPRPGYSKGYLYRRRIEHGKTGDNTRGGRNVTVSQKVCAR